MRGVARTYPSGSAGRRRRVLLHEPRPGSCKCIQVRRVGTLPHRTLRVVAQLVGHHEAASHKRDTRRRVRIAEETQCGTVCAPFVPRRRKLTADLASWRAPLTLKQPGGLRAAARGLCASSPCVLQRPHSCRAAELASDYSYQFGVQTAESILAVDHDLAMPATLTDTPSVTGILQ